jgi:hypothetical protein
MLTLAQQLRAARDRDHMVFELKLKKAQIAYTAAFDLDNSDLDRKCCLCGIRFHGRLSRKTPGSNSAGSYCTENLAKTRGPWVQMPPKKTANSTVLRVKVPKLRLTLVKLPTSSFFLHKSRCLPDSKSIGRELWEGSKRDNRCPT